jgi:hypothetical protein
MRGPPAFRICFENGPDSKNKEVLGMSSLILCDVESCAYHILKEDVGEAYKNQCGNDEVEISKDDSGFPRCFSYEKSG